MVRHTLKILQQMQKDFKSVSDHFGALCIKRVKISFEALNPLKHVYTKRSYILKKSAGFNSNECTEK